MEELDKPFEVPKEELGEAPKKSFFARLFSPNTQEERVKKKLGGVMKDAIKNQDAFLVGYRELSERHGLDFNAVPGFATTNGKALPKDKLERLQKTIARACDQEHVRLIASFRLIPKIDTIAPNAPKEPKQEPKIIVPQSSIIVPK